MSYLPPRYQGPVKVQEGKTTITYTPPRFPLEPIESPYFERSQRDSQWKRFASDICAHDAGRATVIRGVLRRVQAEEKRFDKEGWPGPPLPPPISFVCEAA